MLVYHIKQHVLATVVITLTSPGSFRLYDQDHDGFITKTEMQEIVGAIYKMVVGYYAIIVILYINSYIGRNGTIP